MRRVFVLSALTLLACGRSVFELEGDGGVEGDSCVPGRVVSCPCLSGVNGVQSCLTNGTFGACSCASATGGGSGGGGGGVQSNGGGGGTTINIGGGFQSTGGGTGIVTPVDGGVVLSAGVDTLIDLFPVQGGLIVVRSTRVELLNLQGSVSAEYVSPREITSAAFDGTLLGVGDRAMVNVFNTSLQLLRSANVIESCASSVVVSGSRFVCGPTRDWDRMFSIFDMNTGVMLSNGPEKYTYDGTPMRRVPGTDDFVTVTTDLSPSDFHLKRVSALNSVQNMGESPYHGDFRVTDVYAFDGTPAQHLITSQGLLLRIYGPNCVPSTGYTVGCFIKNGELGTLPNGRFFIGMSDDGAGTVYGISNQGSSNSYFDPQCAMGCAVDRIDVAARVIRGSVTFSAQVARVVATKYDPFQQRVVFGFLKPGTGYNNFNGYEIRAFQP